MKILLSSLVLVFSFSSFAQLDCKVIEKVLDGDDNINYFSEDKTIKFSSKLENKLKRIAVADFYGKCGVSWNTENCYRAEMTDKEVDELGENVSVSGQRTPSKKLYYAVNVGFGGGNGASYYFAPKDLKMEKIMIIDGAECGPIQSILGYN